MTRRGGTYSLRTGGLVIAAVACLAPAGCTPRPKRVEMWPCMGVYAAITVAPSESAALTRYASVARPITRERETELTIYDPGSELSRFNRTAGAGPVRLSPPLYRVLEAAIQYSEVSEGVFDVTVAPLLQLWGFSGGMKPASLPSGQEIDAARLLAGYQKLELSNGMARLAKSGMKIDLGGIAKGFAADACFERIREAGGRNFLMDIAGNLRCSGMPRPDRFWTIAVRNPFDAKRPLGTVRLRNGEAVASSGNYERFVTIGGRRYSHIIDPRTGQPAAGVAGTTVICTSATEADAMSTAMFVLGPEGARNVLKKVPACHALFVPDEQPLRILVTPGFLARFDVAPEFAQQLMEMAPVP